MRVYRTGGVALGGAVIGLILFWIVMAIFWPFFVIWALNALFGFTIAFTLKNWFASLVLCMTVRATVNGSSK